MEGLGDDICGIIKKTKHSVYNKWRTFMKKSKFRFEQHFGRTEEVIFKSELEAKNKKLKLKIDELTQENNKLKNMLHCDFIEDVKQLSNNYKMSVRTLSDEIIKRNNKIKQLKNENRELKKEIRKLKEVSK